MVERSQLKQRLADIATAVERHPHGLGLLGLGSAGLEQNRMDEYSDLDFFAIVEAGFKQRFIDDLSWLEQDQRIAWCFRNTADGYKLFFDDGVFCEFAVFEPDELAHIPYAEGAFVWRDESLDPHFAAPTLTPPDVSDDPSFLLGELLTNLYVGMCRFRRGEKISAMRFVQVYAMDRLLTLLDLSQSGQGSSLDPFCLDRRAEQRHGQHASLLLACSQGAQACPESARHMLDFVCRHYQVERFLENQIRALF